MDQTQGLIRALLYTHTSKTTESQFFPLLLWTEIQLIHTPVCMEVYGPALSQSNFSILSVFCLVYNKLKYHKYWKYYKYGRKYYKNTESIASMAESITNMEEVL